MPLLKRSVTTKNARITPESSNLPFIHQNEKKKSRSFVKPISKVKVLKQIFLKVVAVSFVIICLLVLLVLCILIYMAGMSQYNARNAKDACFVAENSLQTLKLLEKFDRNINESKFTETRNGTQAEGKATIEDILQQFPKARMLLGQKLQDPNVREQFLEWQQKLVKKSKLPIVKSEKIMKSLSSEKFEPRLPKIIHQQWKDQNIPKKFLKWREKWFEFFPKGEYTYMLWDDVSGRKLIEDHYSWFLDTYDAYEYNINRVDATRAFILYHYGGIYADLDYEPLLNFYKYLPSNVVGIIESPYFWNEKTQNALMSSPKADPFWIDVFEKLVQNAGFENILEIAGPILMDQAITSSSSPAYVLPCENFQRVPLGEYTETLHDIVISREMTFRFHQLNGKHCGFYSDNRCHFGKHHNTVSYVKKDGGFH